MTEELSETEFYVEWKDEDKGLAGLVVPNPGIAGRMAFPRDVTRVKVHGELVRQVQAGACYRGRRTKDGLIVGRVEPCPDAAIASLVIRNFTGELDLIKDFAYVRGAMGSIWVSPPALRELGTGREIKQGQRVKGSCRRVMHKDRKTGREVWEWELSSIEVDRRGSLRTFEGSFSGKLTVNPKGFGFVGGVSELAGGCFVSPELIQELHLKDGDRVKGKAKRTWNKRKREWGWTATNISLDGGDGTAVGGGRAVGDTSR